MREFYEEDDSVDFQLHTGMTLHGSPAPLKCTQTHTQKMEDFQRAQCCCEKARTPSSIPMQGFILVQLLCMLVILPTHSSIMHEHTYVCAVYIFGGLLDNPRLRFELCESCCTSMQSFSNKIGYDERVCNCCRLDMNTSPRLDMTV